MDNGLIGLELWTQATAAVVSAALDCVAHFDQLHGHFPVAHQRCQYQDQRSHHQGRFRADQRSFLHESVRLQAAGKRNPTVIWFDSVLTNRFWSVWSRLRFFSTATDRVKDLTCRFTSKSCPVNTTPCSSGHSLTRSVSLSTTRQPIPIRYSTFLWIKSLWISEMSSLLVDSTPTGHCRVINRLMFGLTRLVTSSRVSFRIRRGRTSSVRRGRPMRWVSVSRALYRTKCSRSATSSKTTCSFSRCASIPPKIWPSESLPFLSPLPLPLPLPQRVHYI